MRKKLLTLMLGFSFLLVGTSVAKAGVLTTSTTFVANVATASAIEKKLSLQKASVSFLNIVCSSMIAGGPCSDAISTAQQSLDTAILVCGLAGMGSDICSQALDDSQSRIDTARLICSVTNAQIFPVVKTKKDALSFLPEYVSKKHNG